MWFRLSIGDKLTEKLRWDFMIQNRRQALTVPLRLLEKQQLQNYWLWLHYTPTKSLRLSVSPLCYFESKSLFDLASKASREWRWCVKAEHTAKLAGVQVQNRPGLEYRYRYSALRNIYTGSFRARYMLRFLVPLAAINGRPLNLVALDEVFFQFGGQLTRQQSGFDQNRIYAGLSHEVAKGIKIEAGYCYTYQLRHPSSDIDIQNSLWLSLVFENVFSVFSKKPPVLPHG